ncbi:MAG: helical backbone metal receptor [Myxococcota bacterium]
MHLGLALLALTVGCGPSAARTEAQAGGEAARVVSLAPSLTQMVVGLGRGERLVGATRYCEAPGVAVVGDARPQVERVLAARPELVLAPRYASMAADVAGLRAQGLDVLELPLESVGDARQAMLALGERLGAQAEAAAMVSALDAAMAGARAEAQARTARPGVLLVYEVADGYVYTTGGGDHLAEVLDAVGARNVAAGGALTARLPLERVEAMAPEMIVHVAPSARFGDDAAALAYWRAASPTLPAVVKKRVHVWPNGALATHGPGLAQAVARLSALVSAAAREPAARPAAATASP